MAASTKLLHGKEPDSGSAFAGQKPFQIPAKVLVGSDGALALHSLLLDDYLSQTELSDHQMAALNQRLLPVVRVLESR